MSRTRNIVTVFALLLPMTGMAQTPKPVPGNASAQGQAVSGMSTSPIPGSSTTGHASKPGGGAKHLKHHRKPAND